MIAEKLELTPLFHSIDRTFNQLLQVVESVPEKKLNESPHQDSWTAAQVAEHLIKSNFSICNALVTKGEQPQRDPEERANEIKEMFLNFDLKFKSAEFILPTKDYYPKEVLLTDLKGSIVQLQELDNKVDFSELLQIPALGGITKVELLHLVLYHTQRHIQQIKNVVGL